MASHDLSIQERSPLLPLGGTPFTVIAG